MVKILKVQITTRFTTFDYYRADFSEIPSAHGTEVDENLDIHMCMHIYIYIVLEYVYAYINVCTYRHIGLFK